jgi:hypothetical protein
MLLSSTLPRARGGTASMLFLLTIRRSCAVWPKVSVYGNARAVWVLRRAVLPHAPRVVAEGEDKQGPSLSQALLRTVAIAPQLQNSAIYKVSLYGDCWHDEIR